MDYRLDIVYAFMKHWDMSFQSSISYIYIYFWISPIKQSSVLAISLHLSSRLAIYALVCLPHRCHKSLACGMLIVAYKHTYNMPIGQWQVLKNFSASYSFLIPFIHIYFLNNNEAWNQFKRIRAIYDSLTDIFINLEHIFSLPRLRLVQRLACLSI